MGSAELSALWAPIAAVLCAAICLRIATYSDPKAQYKVEMSLCAWVLAAASGCYSLSVTLVLLAGRVPLPVSPWIVVILAVVAVQVYRARGNVAAVLRVDWEQKWSGMERRNASR